MAEYFSYDKSTHKTFPRLGFVTQESYILTTTNYITMKSKHIAAITAQ